MSVGENIRKIRKQQGLSMAELGEQIGITAAALNRYELGQRKIGVGTLRRIAKALNINPFELYPEDERANAIVAHLRWKLRDDSFSADELSNALSEVPEEYHGEVIAANAIKVADRNVIIQRDEKPVTPKDRVDAAFERLSPEGQQAAAERLEELALLEKYQKKNRLTVPETGEFLWQGNRRRVPAPSAKRRLPGTGKPTRIGKALAGYLEAGLSQRR